MAAKLEWKGNDLWIAGGRQLGKVRRRTGGWEYDVYPGVMPGLVSVSDPYEAETDCRQDLESEVRRLLKEAGVEVDS